MIYTIYNSNYELIAQFDSCKDVAKYLNINLNCLYSYFSKSKKKEKTIKDKKTGNFVYILKDKLE